MNYGILALALSFALASSAFAGGNSDAARNMATFLKDGLGSAAPTVSGRDARSNSGWGNNGSAIVAGDQVSDYRR